MTESKNICITSFNMDIDWENLNIEILDTKKQIKYIILQGEHCKDGKKHIQGFIQFHTKKRLTAVKKLMKDNTLHIEPMRGTPEQARHYCTDEYTDSEGNHKDIWMPHKEYGEIDHTTSGTRTDLIALKDKIKNGEKLHNILNNSEDNKEIHNILQYNRVLKNYQDEVRRVSIKETIKKQYENVVWNDIQLKILDILDKPVDTRKVHWIFDREGNSGKSYLAKYLQTTRDTYYITGGKQNDILYGYDGEEVVIIDLARTYADNLEHIYTIIENLKNGQYLSTKYETKHKLFDIPYIIVLANFKPDKSKLSLDRWDIIDISKTYEELIESDDDTDYTNAPILRQYIENRKLLKKK